MSEPRLTVVIGANDARKTTWARKHRATLQKASVTPTTRRSSAPLSKLVDERTERDRGEGNTFGFERAWSGRSRPDTVRTAKWFGDTTRAIFLATETAAINIRRVRKRVEEGGQHVEESEMRRCWTAAWANLLEAWEAFDTVRVLERSGDVRKTRREVTTFIPLVQWARALPETAPKGADRSSAKR